MNSGNSPKLALGIVSDEISPDFREAVRHGLSWGITRYEIRCLLSGRIPDIDAAEWEDVLRCAKEKGLAITALSPGIFKHPVSKQDEIVREVNETLPRTIAMAKQCGARLIIAFGFQRQAVKQDGEHRVVVEFLRRAVHTATASGMKIAIENEPGFHCDTGRNTRGIIDEVASPDLGANWDPCNAQGTDEIPYPDGYDAIKSVIFNVHAKDTMKGALTQCVPIGEGIIDWQGQMNALMHDGVVNHVTIETHCLPLVEKSAKNVRTLRAMMDKAR